MSPHLLSLPGEIRNRIYEFVFTEEDGVCYHEDVNGVGWLCVYNKKEDSDRLGLAAREDQDDEFENETDRSQGYPFARDGVEDDIAMEEYLDYIEEQINSAEGYSDDGEDDSDDSEGDTDSMDDDRDSIDDDNVSIKDDSDDIADFSGDIGDFRAVMKDHLIKTRNRRNNIKDNNENLQDYVDDASEHNTQSDLKESIGHKMESTSSINDNDLLKGIHELDKTRDLVKVNSDGHVVLNQLQFVCSQLRKETKGLPLHDNTVLFFPWGVEEDAIDHCTKFIKCLPDKHKMFLKTLVIIQQDGWHVSDVEPLVSFCHMNSNIQIHFNDSNLSHHPAFMVTTAMMCEIRMGRSVSLVKRLNRQGRAVMKGSIYKELSETISKIDNCPDNFRMFPRSMAFDEATFRKRAAKSDYVMEAVVPGIKGGMDAFVACVKDFMGNGW